mmetsp:Transcript_24111/g.33892  ORF Transcript_24111/g.33892 Transcript_24111/m.33892 type:complete len:222 (-) Transcript_24111:414-1079(-)
MVDSPPLPDSWMKPPTALLLKTWNCPMDLSLVFLLSSIPIVKTLALETLSFLRMVTAPLLLLNSLISSPPTSLWNASNVTEHPKSNILVLLWLPPNVASTTWAARSLVLTSPSVTSPARHLLKSVKHSPMIRMLLPSNAVTPFTVLTTNFSLVLLMILLLVRTVLFWSTPHVDLPKLMISLESSVTRLTKCLRKKPTTIVPVGNTFLTQCTWLDPVRPSNT